MWRCGHTSVMVGCVNSSWSSIVEMRSHLFWFASRAQTVRCVFTLRGCEVRPQDPSCPEHHRYIYTFSKNGRSWLFCRCTAAVMDILLPLKAYPLQDVAAEMFLRNWCLSSIIPNVYVMSFSHLCLGFLLRLFPATIPCIAVFSKP